MKWSRLYGGAIAVILLDGVDYSKPMDVERVGPGQFRGLLVLIAGWSPQHGRSGYGDWSRAWPSQVLYGRWFSSGAARYAHSPLALLAAHRDELPYWQAVAENLWGMSGS